jgi:hypothetical protein
MNDSLERGSVNGAPRTLLRAEGAAVLALCVAAYGTSGAHWGLFAALFLVPDLAILGYLLGPRIGAASYNAAHWHVLPAALFAAGHALGSALAVSIALIWAGHIGFDRVAGYGLKYATAFGDTHLGRKGRSVSA